MTDNKFTLKDILKHLLLFVLTFVSTVIAGVFWIKGKPVDMINKWTQKDWYSGFMYAWPFLLFLTFHEFGHFFTAIKYKVKTTLPYYIPFPPLPIFPITIGTMGAVIRLKGLVKSRKEYFDIGVAGPLAGFIIAFGLLWYGYTHLPPQEYQYEIHPEYNEAGKGFNYSPPKDENTIEIFVGDNLLTLFFEKYVVEDYSLLPSKAEIIHYPFLFVGYLALIFTALNLLPIGQLDGGHVLFGLFGRKWQGRISLVFFILFILYAGTGFISSRQPIKDLLIAIPLYLLFLYFILGRVTKDPLTKILLALSIYAIQYFVNFYFPNVTGYTGWLFFSLIIGRFIGIYHPPAIINNELSMGRKIIGWVAIIIFIISFSPQPLIIE
ncbi:site-2 protease family protein [Marinigracilibium pacificum]|uniref:Site-2 protease family protein n=1 Tax=Marinigracilibium pacificum TaxID=2729599 RepID=A0A848J1Q8_9BACT|nr:site-2 protease family protein [Marinigracilibium pacificum]NMM49278.1 site-2 protease family protein [Marinigracilibium pacificum]